MPPPPASAGAGAFKEDEMRTIAMLLLAIAACSAEILRYDTDTPILPYGVSHDWRGVYFDLDDWDTMSYPHATGTFRVDSIEIWTTEYDSIQVAIFSDSMTGSSGPQNIVWEVPMKIPSPNPEPVMVACGGVEMSDFFWIGVADNDSENLSFNFSTQWSPYGIHSYYWPSKQQAPHHLLIRAHGEWVPYQALQSSTWGCIKANLGY